MTESPQANTTPLAAIGHQQMQPPGGAPSSTPSEPQEDLSTKYDKKLAELTSKFDGLSRRERMLLQKEREIQEKSSHVEQYENLKELAKKSPAQLLEKFGITYDQLTDYYASQTPEDETSRTVGSLKQELAELKKQMEVQKTEGQAKEIAKVREQKLEALKNLANKDDSPYGLISQFGSYEDVLIYMGQHYQATGEILDDQTAMEAVEKQLEENLKVLAKSNKVRKLLGFDQAISSPEVQSHKSITLSNNFGSEAPRTQDTRGLSEAQLFELALQQMPDLK